MKLTALQNLPPASKLTYTLATIAGIVLIGAIDYSSGIEYRVFPLYFLPVSLAAWRLDRRSAFAASVSCTLIWIVVNGAAGLHFSSTRVWVFNATTLFCAFAAIGHLIGQLRLSADRERELSRTDGLTSLLNARAFNQEVERILLLGHRHRHPVTLAYIDLDNFKAVNDTLGHHGGDAVLRRAADVFRASLRGGDIAARLGGDEFVVLLPETNSTGAMGVLERLRAELAETLSQERCPVTVSVGAVSFTIPPMDVAAMLRHADALMYSAKASGKNRVCLEVVQTQDVDEEWNGIRRRNSPAIATRAIGRSQ